MDERLKCNFKPITHAHHENSLSRVTRVRPQNHVPSLADLLRCHCWEHLMRRQCNKDKLPQHLKAPPLDFHTNLCKRGSIIIRVHDNGINSSAEILNHVLDGCALIRPGSHHAVLSGRNALSDRPASIEMELRENNRKIMPLNSVWS